MWHVKYRINAIVREICCMYILPRYLMRGESEYHFTNIHTHTHTPPFHVLHEIFTLLKNIRWNFYTRRRNLTWRRKKRVNDRHDDIFPRKSDSVCTLTLFLSIQRIKDKYLGYKYERVWSQIWTQTLASSKLHRNWIDRVSLCGQTHSSRADPLNCHGV